MFLFLRFIPILVALTAIVGSMALFWFPTHFFLVTIVALLVLFALLNQLNSWDFKKIETWIFSSTPFLLALSSFILLWFLEDSGIKILVIFLLTFLIWLFTENLFTFLHLPGAYQVNALEYLSLVVSVVSFYFFTVALFAARIFLGVPLWILVLFFVVFVFILSASTFWICKVEKEKVFNNAIGGTVLLAEFFAALSFLPTGFFPNAGLVTLIFYLFLGIVRSHLLGKLTKTVLKRYLITACVMAVLIIITARWT
jgi:hypothetical protein